MGKRAGCCSSECNEGVIDFMITRLILINIMLFVVRFTQVILSGLST